MRTFALLIFYKDRKYEFVVVNGMYLAFLNMEEMPFSPNTFIIEKNPNSRNVL